jgi:cell division septal protein FtsQ
MRKKSQKKDKKRQEEDIYLARHKKRLEFLKTRRNFQRMQITIARLRVLLRIGVVGALFYLLIKMASLPQWYLDPAIFNVYPSNSLQITGNQIVPTANIIETLRKVPLPHKPIYLINTNEMEKALLGLSPIKKVYIRRFWLPARLNIAIHEKTPVLAVAPTPKVTPVAVFTDDSTIIGREYLPLKYKGTVYTLLTYDDYTKWPPKHIRYFIELAKLLEDSSGQKLVYLDIRNPDDIYAQLQSVKIRLGELDPMIFTRATKIKDVISEALKIQDEVDYIDLRWEKSVSMKLKDKLKDEPPEIRDLNI